MTVHLQHTPAPARKDDARFTLEAGRNCWRVEDAARAAFLVDGAAYFAAFRAAALEARRSIFILGWDFDSRVRMLIGRESDGFPDELGEFLHSLLARRRELHIYVLIWDFHLIYFRERQWWLPWKLSAHRRLHFVKDGMHPVGAAQHQKLVVVDGAVAFCGGLDFAQCRWDTPSHEPNHPQRRLADEAPCRPFHDVQMMVDGDAAFALEQLAKERWTAATGHSFPAAPRTREGGRNCWPASVEPDMQGARVGIARTMPEWEEQKPVREVEQLFLDSIRAARRFIYVETQYLTSSAVAQGLAARLQEEHGPEIVLILHPNSDGWLEQHTMDVLRGRILKRLRTLDRFDRLALYYPRIPGLHGQCISMHAKVCIIDDEFVRIGSANLSNRSMGFDSECDLAVSAAGDETLQRDVRAFRLRLLAEHLGVEPSLVARREEEKGTLAAAIESLRTSERSLETFDSQIPPEVDEWVPDQEFLDPSRPYEEQLVPHEHREPAHRQAFIGAAALLALLGVSAAWQWTPLRAWLDVPALVDHLQSFGHSPLAPMAAILGFVVGGVMVMPVTALIAVTVLAFGPVGGFVYALVGMTLSAMVTFGIGRFAGQRFMRRLSGSRFDGVSRKLAAKGVLAVVAVRIIPVAPFSIVNAVAGASHIRTRDFMLGTVIGEVPGLLGLAVFVDQITETFRHPGPGSFILLGAVAVIILLGVVLLRRWLRRRDEGGGRPHDRRPR